MHACTQHTKVLHVVDLAGSERLYKSNADGLHLREGIHINQSLLGLNKARSDALPLIAHTHSHKSHQRCIPLEAASREGAGRCVHVHHGSTTHTAHRVTVRRLIAGHLGARAQFGACALSRVQAHSDSEGPPPRHHTCARMHRCGH